ncbi:MAG: ABC transporter permease [Intrasporangium sp.]|uniref:ABC transporter permease n=1 Tax=Intrasporangium sp. TaxID=1925024 RepID=UPI003F804E4C
MSRYILRRVLLAIPVALGATFLIFLVVFALPGDPIKALAGGQHVLSPSVEQALRARYHLDDSLPIQYLKYMSGLLRGDLGEDFNGRSVSTIIAESWPATAKLGVTAFLIEIVVGIPIGIWAGLRKGKPVDYLVLGATILAFAVPIFVIGYTTQILFGINLGWFPVAGIDDGWPTSYLLPAIVLGILGLATTARLMRTSLVETLSADFIRTAVAKGLPRRRIIVNHALRNSLIPVVTYLAIDLGGLLGGAVIIEGIFNIPGLGFQIFEGIKAQNGPVVVGISTLLVLIFLAANLLVDVIYAVLDPRIRYD